MPDHALLPQGIKDLSLVEQVAAIFDAAPYLPDKINDHCELVADSTPMQGMLEVLRFLSLINAQHTITPSERVDKVWHQFILSTRVYGQYCTNLYQKYLHHTPSNDKVENHQQFEQCLRLYTQRYGKPDPNFWGAPWLVNTHGDCSGCETL